MSLPTILSVRSSTSVRRVVVRGVMGVLAVAAVGLLPLRPAMAIDGQLELRTIDKETRKPVACRMHLKTAAGKPRFPKKVVMWGDHFVIPGKILLKLPLGSYTFEIERGPEYPVFTGHFTLNKYADDSKEIELPRHVDMSSKGWWSGDLDVRRPERDIDLVMASEDLHVVPLVTWWNAPAARPLEKAPPEAVLRFNESRLCPLLGGQQTEPGGTLSYFNLTAPLSVGAADAEYPPLAQFVQEAKKQPAVWIDATRPYWWDLPTLVALGLVDSIQVAHGDMGRAKMLPPPPGARPRDEKLYASVRGIGQWSHDVYFHLLNCGLRIPPSAGSGSGLGPNPAGYNRVYVHVDGPLTMEKWWEGLRAGQVTVTNGPLLQPTVAGELPGHVFHEPAGGYADLEIGLTLSTREPINYLEIIKDGRVEHEVSFEQYRQGGRLPKLRFDQSGWCLVRAVTSLPNTYRFAMTGPYYVEIGDRPRISKKSAQFLLDWVVERERQVKELEDPTQRAEVLKLHEKARAFWQDLVSKANAE